jgi:hypothetical protein
MTSIIDNIVPKFVPNHGPYGGALTAGIHHRSVDDLIKIIGWVESTSGSVLSAHNRLITGGKEGLQRGVRSLNPLDGITFVIRRRKILVVLALLVWLSRQDWKQYLRLALSRMGKSYQNKMRLRSLFNNFTKVELDRVSPVHTHGVCATIRQQTRQQLIDMAKGAGYRVYSVSMSTRDQREGIEGSRVVYHAKDAGMQYQNDARSEDDITVMVDVAGHVENIDEYLLDGTPLVIKGFMPTAVHEDQGEYTFRANENKTFDVNVAGGLCVPGEGVWNFDKDAYTVTSGARDCYWTFTTVQVEKRQVAKHEAAVLVMPTHTWKGPAAWLARFLIPQVPIERLDIVQVVQPEGKPREVWGRMRVQTVKGMKISIGRIDQPGNACTVDESVFNNILAQKRSSQCHVSSAVRRVARAHPEMSVAEAENAGLVLNEYAITATNAIIPRVVVCDPVEVNQAYSFNVLDHALVPEKPLMVNFGKGPDPNGTAPTNHWKNQEVGEAYRMRKQIAESRLNNPPSWAMRKIAAKVVARTADIVKGLTPLTDEELLERQLSPSAKAKLQQYMDAIPGRRNDGAMGGQGASTFVKAECATPGKDPRIICNADQAAKVASCRLAAPMAGELKEASWYGFAAPDVVDARVNRVMSHNPVAGVIVTDYERFDGSINRYVREDLDQPLIETAFIAYVRERWEWYNTTTHQEISWSDFLHLIIRHWNSEFATLSGEGGTSVLHTCRNRDLIVIATVLFYEDHRNGGGYDRERALDMALANPAIHAGDDGMAAVPTGHLFDPSLDTAAIFKAKTEIVAKQWGLKLKADIIRPWNPAPFCGRLWYSWVEGECNSMADVKRRLSSFMMTRRVEGVSKENLLQEKAEAAMLTDSSTPILGELSRYCLEWLAENALYTQDLVRHRGVTNWAAEQSLLHGTQYRNVHADWMDEWVEQNYHFDHHLLLSAFQAGVSPFELPYCVEHAGFAPGKQSYMINGEVIHPVNADGTEQPKLVTDDPIEVETSTENSTTNPTESGATTKEVKATAPKGNGKENGESKTSERQRASAGQQRGQRGAGRPSGAVRENRGAGGGGKATAKGSAGHPHGGPKRIPDSVATKEQKPGRNPGVRRDVDAKRTDQGTTSTPPGSAKAGPSHTPRHFPRNRQPPGQFEAR